MTEIGKPEEEVITNPEEIPVPVQPPVPDEIPEEVPA